MVQGRRGVPFALVFLVAMADSATGGAYRLGLLYLGPIALASYLSGRIAGFVVLAVRSRAGQRAATCGRLAWRLRC
jgi:hypothetical protein